MSVAQSTVALNTSTATLINPVISTAHPTIAGQLVYPWNTATLTIQNTHATATVYLGTSAVTSSAYGISLLAGTAITLDGLLPTEGIYGITTAASSLSILAILR